MSSPGSMVYSPNGTNIRNRRTPKTFASQPSKSHRETVLGSIHSMISKSTHGHKDIGSFISNPLYDVKPTRSGQNIPNAHVNIVSKSHKPIGLKRSTVERPQRDKPQANR